MKQIPNELFFCWVEGEIAEGRSVRFRSKGVSMYPLIRGDKDDILLIPCDREELKAMDVVLFRYRGRHVMHRIVRREGDLLILKGDGSYTAMEECSVNDVIGIVNAVIKPSGKFVSVESRRWKLPSFIWSKMGILRNPILRIIHLFLD